MTAIAARLRTMGAFAFKCRFISTAAIRSGKIVPYKLSDIGEGIHEVTVKEWFIKAGDRVSQFDDICEVQSDKASVTITSRYDGVVRTLHYKINDVARVGNALVDIELEEDDEGKNAADPAPGDPVREEVELDRLSSTETTRANKVLTTPAVRRLAFENNIDLTKVAPTGRDGRIMKEDVLAYLANSGLDSAKPDVTQQPTEGRVVPLKRYTKHMYKTMTQSLSIPHFVYSDECDVTKLVRLRNEVKEDLAKQGVSLSFTPFFMKAASRALEQFPELNAWLDEESQSVRSLPDHNISVAMDTPEGLVVPNIKQVQNLNVLQIAKELNRLQNAGKNSSFQINDLSDGTFTLSNIGVVGGTYTKPVILPPQVAIGALGKIQRVPRFDEQERVIAASVLSISWAADHRVVDGMTMARFSNLWKQYVEKPSYLILGL